jgi:hypothetical protein
MALGTQITQVMAKARRKKVPARRTGEWLTCDFMT